MRATNTRVAGAICKRPAARPNYIRLPNWKPLRKLRDQNWSAELEDFLTCKNNERKLVKGLIKHKIQRNWDNAICPYCQLGNVGKYRDIDTRKGEGRLRCGWRCTADACHKRLYPGAFRPVLGTSGHGQVPLYKRTACLFNAVLGVQQNHTHIQLNMDKKAVRKIYQDWRKVRAQDVQQRQKKMVLGDGVNWVDAEADEVTIAKRKTQESNMEAGADTATKNKFQTKNNNSSKKSSAKAAMKKILKGNYSKGRVERDQFLGNHGERQAEDAHRGVHAEA